MRHCGHFSKSARKEDGVQLCTTSQGRPASWHLRCDRGHTNPLYVNLNGHFTHVEAPHHICNCATCSTLQRFPKPAHVENLNTHETRIWKRSRMERKTNANATQVHMHMCTTYATQSSMQVCSYHMCLSCNKAHSSKGATGRHATRTVF